MSSAPADQVSKPAHKSTVHSSEYRKVSAIQMENSCILPKHLNIMSICAYYNKLLQCVTQEHTWKSYKRGKRDLFACI